MCINLANKYPFSCRKILRHGTEGFSSPPKEGVLLIFVAVKSPTSSAGFEPENLGSKGKHPNHKITEADKLQLLTRI
jgi:hypothetical protein